MTLTVPTSRVSFNSGDEESAAASRLLLSSSALYDVNPFASLLETRNQSVITQVFSQDVYDAGGRVKSKIQLTGGDSIVLRFPILSDTSVEELTYNLEQRVLERTSKLSEQKKEKGNGCTM